MIGRRARRRWAHPRTSTARVHRFAPRVAATEAEFGAELYVADEAGVRRIEDLVPGQGSSMPAAISAISGGRVLFSAQDPQFGRETWLAGPDGATRLFDLEPGRASGIGGALEPGYVVHGDQLTFYGRAGSWGEELFATGAAALDDTAAECRSDRQCPEGTWCVGFVCARVEPPPSFDGAAAGCGCGASGRPQGAWSFLVLAALWAGRRRR